MIRKTISLTVEDFVGQGRMRASGIPRTSTVADMIDALSRQMNLPNMDSQGRPVLYGARTERGVVLNASDIVEQVLEDEQTITLTKSVTAGGFSVAR